MSAFVRGPGGHEARRVAERAGKAADCRPWPPWRDGAPGAFDHVYRPRPIVVVGDGQPGGAVRDEFSNANTASET